VATVVPGAGPALRDNAGRQLTGNSTRAAVPGASGAAFRPTLPAQTAMTPRQVPGYGKLPVRFEPNVGQAPPQIEYLARGNNYIVAITERGLMLSLSQGATAQNGARIATRTARASVSPAQLRLHLVHATVKPLICAEQPQSSVSNYFIGNDSSRWRSNVANYAAVRYKQVYPGIDWLVYGNPQQLEYDFAIAPRADPRQIELDIEGAGAVSVDDKGDLLVKVNGHSLRQLKPVIYQTAGNGLRHQIDGHYVLRHRHLSFALAAYDRSRELIIDPALVYSTYLGGSGGDSASAIAVDTDGNAYIAGATSSTDFPTVNPLQATNRSTASVTHPTNAFVAKLNATGTALIYSTYLGGSGIDAAYGISVDSSGNAYIAGSTTSTDFPVAAPFQATNHAVGPANFAANAFVTKLNAAGNGLVYSTYLGGSGPGSSSATADSARAIAVDSAGNAYVVGQTASPDFPTVNPFQATYKGGSAVGSNAFVTKFNSAGSALVYSTYLGGSFSDAAASVAVDSAGSAYVAGATGSTDFPTVAPFQATNNAQGVGFPANELGHFFTAFLTKLNAAGSALTYSTYLGGSGVDGAAGVAVDSGGEAYVTGATTSPDFPTVNPFQSKNFSVAANPYTAFVTRFNAAGNALVYSTYLGGNSDDQARAIAVDAAGNAYIAGYAFSLDFPVDDPVQEMNKGVPNGAANAFVSVLNASGSALQFSTFLGGTGSAAAAQQGQVDSATALAVDGTGAVYVTGITYSVDFPTAMALQTSNKSTNPATLGTAFVAKMVTRSGVATQLPPVQSEPPGGGGTIGWGLIGTAALAVAMRCRKRVSIRG